MRYLLVGGSNCVMRGGYGAALQARVDGQWTNRSLGNSPSLRGVDHLLSHPDEVAAADRIVFEYTLNDLIFEGSNTLDANTHADVLRALVGSPGIAPKLVFVLLLGQGALARVAAGQSFVADHYRAVADEHGVPVIDLMPLIAARAGESGSRAVFKDNDHFTDSMIPVLVEATTSALASVSSSPSASTTVPAVARASVHLKRVHPLRARVARGVEEAEFRSTLLTTRLARLAAGASIEVESPGGVLVGLYARNSHTAGLLRITSNDRDVVKSLRHRFAYPKPFVAMRHLTAPIRTAAGERIVLRRLERLAEAPAATLDGTLAQVANAAGGEVEIGDLLFIQSVPATGTDPAVLELDMPSTLRQLHAEPAEFDPSRVVGRFARSAEPAARRLAEGGLRLQGRHKRSLPDRPLVSIVTVSLNSATTIEQTIASVMRQTYDNVEYIVVDGASTDGTLDCIRQHEQAIDYFVSEPDSGLYAAMNKGIGLASGELLLVLNSDDWYADDAVEALVAAKRYSGCDFVSALAQYVDGEGRPVEVMRSMPFDASTRLRMPLRHETMLLPASVYERFGGYDDAYRVIADFDLTRKLYEAGLTHYELPRPLLYFRNTGVSSTALDKLKSDRTRLIGQQFPGLPPEDLEQLATMAKLRPESVESLARRHFTVEPLTEALHAYQSDQARRPDAPAWRRQVVDWSAIERLQQRPQISVILPVYMAAETLPAALESVLAQTLSDLEVICLDDASPDESRAVIEQYARRDSRVKLLVNERNLGLGATRNRGIRSSRGAFVFHLDPDDALPPRALEQLYAVAVRYGSDMVKGDYLREQMLHSQARGRSDRFSLLTDGQPVFNTTLAEMPRLLRTTEGHWSYLYRGGFARQVPYPTDLKMGQDSIFLVNALARARSISLIPEVVYHYRSNPASAMNSFNFRKHADGLEWRRRAWHVLRDRGLKELGERLLSNYWSDAFFTGLARCSTAEQQSAFFSALRAALAQAGIAAPSPAASPLVRSLFASVLAGDDPKALALLRDPPSSPAPARAVASPPAAPKTGATVRASGGAPVAAVADDPTPPLAAAHRAGAPALARTDRPLRVATFCSLDQGGAATGSHRRIEALRRRGVDAVLHSLVAKSGRGYVRRVTALADGIDPRNGEAVWQEVRRQAVLPVVKLEGYRAQELFSLARSVVDFRKLMPVLDRADVVHFHWVVGMLDFANAHLLADKPMVWTLADMNAFTGGCHYSEGCDGYKRDCDTCPLLGGRSQLANESWQRKRDAYRQLRRLHIVCPSQWMADRVRASTLLGDKPIHMIPNAFPIDRLTPTNKVVARLRLGLPVDRKLLLFGADSVANKRKGRDWLIPALQALADRGVRDVEVVLFGSGSIELPLPTHRLGHIADEGRLALAYSAADAFLFPSSEDNAPLTVGESLLCGTPVVAFPVGNVSDLLHHRETGYLARYQDVADLVNGIDWALGADANTAIRRSLRCRQSAAAYHDPLVAADRHLKVYEEAMSHA